MQRYLRVSLAVAKVAAEEFGMPHTIPRWCKGPTPYHDEYHKRREHADNTVISRITVMPVGQEL